MRVGGWVESLHTLTDSERDSKKRRDYCSLMFDLGPLDSCSRHHGDTACFCGILLSRNTPEFEHEFSHSKKYFLCAAV